MVVDPERNVDGYLAYLARNELKLRGIFLTHPHADFVPGHAELAARSGAGIFISGRAPATFVHRDLKEGDRLALGTLELEIIETPGHSPDSICLSVLESGVPVALFSGDTLFAGDVGRPDLRDGEVGSQELAAMLHDSLFDKLLKLPSEVKVYPAHGAGSLCGRQISSAPFTTIGQEAATNWALQFTDREQFVTAMVANLPDRPPYFSRSMTINLQGAPFLSDRPALTHLGPAIFCENPASTQIMYSIMTSASPTGAAGCSSSVSATRLACARSSGTAMVSQNVPRRSGPRASSKPDRSPSPKMTV